MKTIKFLSYCLFVTMISFCFSACNDDDPEETIRPPYMYAEQTLFEIDATAQTITVTLNTNIPMLDIWVPGAVAIKDPENRIAAVTLTIRQSAAD